MVGLLGDRLEGGLWMEMEKPRPVVRSLWLRQLYTKRQEQGLKGQGFLKKKKVCTDSQNRDEKLSVCTSWRRKNVTAPLFPFLGQTVLAKLFYSR